MPAAAKRTPKGATRPAPKAGKPPRAPKAQPGTGAPEPGAEPAAGLGRALAVRRAELGLTRKEVAARAALSYPYVAELERGRKAPSAAALRAIAAALEVTPSELLARAEQLSAAARSRAGGPRSADGAAEDERVRPRPAARADDAELAALVRDIVRVELTAARVGSTDPDADADAAADADAGPDGDSRAPRRGAAVPSTASAPGSASATANATAGSAAAASRSPAALRDGVLTAMREMLDNPDIDFDSEGDIPIRRNDVMLFVRVLEDPSSVLVFSPMIVGIDESAALLERINDLNANVHFVRFCLTHGGVVADIELFAEPFEPALVTAACRTLTQTAELVGPDLQEEYGGRLFFGDEHEPKPRPGTGGYL